MGTYTTNKNLFMPTVGETGWGTLVNENFSTIDTFLKPITVSGSTYTFTGNHVGNQSGGSISATSISNSGTSTFTGKITANGGIGTKALTATSISNSGTLTQTGTSTFTGKITANGGIGTKALTATTGTFSGNVTAKNVNVFGAYPMTLALLGGDNSNNYVTPDGVMTMHNYQADPNEFTKIELCHNVQISSNATTKIFKLAAIFELNEIPIVINEIKIIGSWSIGLYCDGSAEVGDVDVYLNDIKLSANRTNPTSLSLTQAENIFRNMNTVKLVNKGFATSYANSSVYMVFKNTGNERQYIRQYPLGFL